MIGVTPVLPRKVKGGRGDWIRTSDPLRPRQVRYQAALRPDRRIRRSPQAMADPKETAERRVQIEIAD